MSYFHAINGQGGSPEPTPSNDHPPVLLWTNTDTSTDFTAQTVELDLSEYAGVIIEYNHAHGNNTFGTRIYAKKTDNYASAGAGFNSDNTAFARNILSVTNTGVEFGNASSGSTQANYSVIPTKIYGVQEYVVEPVVGDLLWTNPSTTTAFNPQKISVDLSNAKGAVIEVMVSTTTQIVCSKQLVYKGDGPVGVGYSASGVAQTRNITSVEADGITFETGYSANTASTTILIPYKIYSIN